MVCTGTKEDDNADVATPVPSTNAVRNENPMMKFHCLSRLSVTVMQMKMESFILRQSKENQSSGQTEQKEMYVIALKTGYISDNYRYGWNYGTTWKERYKNFGYGFVERI